MDHIKKVHWYDLCPSARSEIDAPIPRVLHMIWVGKREEPEFFQQHVAQWIDLMPEWTVRAWRNEDLTETHFEKDVLDLVARTDIGAQKADILRYHILESQGGVYVDADVVPHRSMEPIVRLGNPLVICHDLPLTCAYISIGFIAAAPRHVVLRDACRRCRQVDFSNMDIPFQTGPRVFGLAVFETQPTNGGPYALLPSDCFYHNRTGDPVLHEGTNEICGHRALDVEARFGSHTYARMW